MKTVAESRRVVVCLSALLILIIVAAPALQARIATADEMETVCRNWVSYIVTERGKWAESPVPEFGETRMLTKDGQLLAHCFAIKPIGYVVVPILKELPPIKAYSTESDLDVSATGGVTQLLRDVLADRLKRYVDIYGDLEVEQPVQGEILYDSRNGRQWDRFLVSPEEFEETLVSRSRAPMDVVGPLLTTIWNQSSPYNDYCPMGDGGRCVVGCVATAFSQIIAYHQWPLEGDGSYTYWWDGDWSCEGQTPGAFLTANFYDPYDWDNIINSCPFGCEPEEEAAMAELCYEVGVALEMSYGNCASGAWPGIMLTHMPTYFGYSWDIEELYRSNYMAEEWFNIIVDQIDLGQPMEYCIYSHSIVCDGYSTNDDLMLYHINYGWGGSHNSWFALDGIHCPWEGCDPMWEDLIRNIKPDKAAVIYADTTIGWVPFDVNFTGSSDLSVDAWAWDFGDGGSSALQSPVHTYETAGFFDVTLQVTAGTEVRQKIKPDYILSLADSLIGEDASGLPGGIVEVVVYACNMLPLSQIRVPVLYAGDLDLTYQSFSTAGCRTDTFDLKQQIQYVPSSKKTTFKLLASTSGSGPDLEPGTGPVLKLYFEVSGQALPDQSTLIDLGGYTNYAPMFYSDRLDYEVRTSGAIVTYGEPSGCVGIRGNVDNDPDDIIDISDLVYLIDYMFRQGPEPSCAEEADIDGNGIQDISDLVRLVDYMFNDGTPPAPC